MYFKLNFEWDGDDDEKETRKESNILTWMAGYPN